eukprot:CAMPEP_0180141840 /NCGR_PEP_ID=MMETSP0986-20121125/15185_1 /TAXON_ID=697907 /ORGANISM="non described non described, Strain CCMP2293" /LENGTH=163 /DNA_ID=CAMNT_0022084845 /DNA_START=57 /DNA_END=548 /DNA_ORIENTATION=+
MRIKASWCSCEHGLELLVVDFARAVRVCLVDQAVDVHCQLECLDGAAELFGLDVAALVERAPHRHERVYQIAFVVLGSSSLLLRLNDFEELRKLDAPAPVVVHLAEHLKHLLVGGVLPHRFQRFFELPRVDGPTAILVESLERLPTLVNLFLCQHPAEPFLGC